MQPGDGSSDETTSVSLLYDWAPNELEEHDDQVTSTWLPSHGGAPRRRPTFSNRDAVQDPSTWADVEAATRRLEAEHAASTLRTIGAFQMDWDEDESTTHAHRPPQYAPLNPTEIERPRSAPPPLPSPRRAAIERPAPTRAVAADPRAVQAGARAPESRPVARPPASVPAVRQAQPAAPAQAPITPSKAAARLSSRQKPSAELRRERATVPQPTAAAFAREVEANEAVRAIRQQLQAAEAQNERLGEQVVDLLDRLKLSEARTTEASEEIVSLIERLRAGDARASDNDRQLYAMFERSNESEARATQAEQKVQLLASERDALPLRPSDFELAPSRVSGAKRWPLWLALAFAIGCGGSLYFASYLPVRQRLTSALSQVKQSTDAMSAQRASWERERTDLLSQLTAAKAAAVPVAPPPAPVPVAKVPAWKRDHSDVTADADGDDRGADRDARADEREERENREAEREARAADRAARAAERATKKAEREAKLAAAAAAKRDATSTDEGAKDDAATDDASDKPAKKHGWSARAHGHHDSDVKPNEGAEGAPDDESTAGQGSASPSPKAQHSDTGSEKVSDDPLDGLD